MRLNLAVFTSDYTNMQLTYRGPAPAGVAPFITNAGETSIDGAEVGVHLGAHAMICLIEASVGYLDATIDSLSNIPLAVLPPGLRRRKLPAVRAGVAGAPRHWRTPFHAGKIEIKPRVDASFQPTTFFDATNTPEIAQLDDVTTVNARWKFSKGDDSPWSFTVGVNNATDEEYPDRGQLLADHGQRLRGDRLFPAAASGSRRLQYEF